jgi:hypothetical protein
MSKVTNKYHNGNGEYAQTLFSDKISGYYPRVFDEGST